MCLGVPPGPLHRLVVIREKPFRSVGSLALQPPAIDVGREPEYGLHPWCSSNGKDGACEAGL